MGRCWNCLFGCGYCLYARTCVGRGAHVCMLRSFRKHHGEDAVHTAVSPFLLSNDLMVMPVPFLVNNYTYVVADLAESTLVCVDVGDAARMIKIGVEPTAILTTHKHWDHSGGNRAMKKAFPGLRVYGGEKDRVPDVTHTVKDGEVITFGRLRFTCILTPGHTRGHIVYRLHGAPFHTVDSVFTGDHVMLACCGATFEGSRGTMIESLNLMCSLPDDTLVWPGHELGLMAIESAIYIQPDNLAALSKCVYIIARRANDLSTCPSTIGEEKAYNPFLRTANPQLHESLGIAKFLAEDPEFKDQPLKIQEYTFEAILARMEGLRQLKEQMKEEKKQAKKNQDEALKDQGVQTDSGMQSPKRALFLKDLYDAQSAAKEPRQNSPQEPEIAKTQKAKVLASVTSGSPGSTPLQRNKVTAKV